MKTNISYLNIFLFIGVIAFICSIPLFIFDRLYDYTTPKLYPELLGLTIVEAFSIIFILFLTLIIAIFDPYKIEINGEGLLFKYVFIKNKKFNWRDIGRIQLKTQIFGTVALLRILKGFSYKKCGVYRTKIYGDLIRYIDRRKITTEKFDEKDFELF